MSDKYDDKKQLVALPFGELEKIKYSKSQSLTEMIKEVNLDILLSPGVDTGRVFVDGVLVTQEAWSSTIPVEGSVVHIGVVPEGGGGSGKIIRSIAMIVVMAVAWWAGPIAGAAMFGAGTAAAGVAGGVIAAGIGIAGMLAVNALIPMPGLSGKTQDSLPGSSNSMLGINNASRPYEPIQRLFGTNKFFPPYAIAPFTEIVGDKTIGYYVFCIGKDAYDLSEMQIGNTALSNYSEYTIQQGFKDDINIFKRGDINEENLAVNLTKADGPFTQTTVADTTEISLDIVCNGMFRIDEDNGKVKGIGVEHTIEYRPTSGGSWIPFTAPAFSRKKQTRLAINYSVSGLAADTYDVRITRVTIDHTPDVWDSNDSSFISSAFTWSKLRSIKSTFPWTLDNVTLVALKIRLDGQINAGVDTFNLMATSLLAAWNGASWDAAVASRNPAWVYTEILKGDSNRRAVLDGELDLAGFLSWASSCESEGFYFDGVIENRGTVYRLLSSVAAVGRATPGRTTTGKYTVVRDINQTVRTQMITPLNSWDFSGRKAFQDIPHALKCRFTNSEMGYLPDEMVVYRSGYNIGNATLFETVDFPYITTPDHVWKLAVFHIAQALLRPEIFNISMDFEHIANNTTRGSKVGFSYDAILVGLGSALVKSVSLNGSAECTGLTMNNSLTMETAKTYGMNVRRSIDGRQISCSIVLDLGEQTSITFSPVIPFTDVPAIGDLVNYGESGLIDLDCMVQSISPINDSDAVLALVEDAPAVRTAGDGTPGSHDSKITHPGKYNEIPYSVDIEGITIVSQRESLSRLNQTGNISVSIDFLVDATSGVPAASFQCQYYDQEDTDGEWVPTPNVIGADARSVEVSVENGLTYNFRVRSVSRYGETSDWDTYNDYTVNYTVDYAPNELVGVALLQGGAYWYGRDVQIGWGLAADLWNVVKYRVRVFKTSPLTLLRNEYVDKLQLFYSYSFEQNSEDNGGVPITALTFRVTAISQTENESSSVALVVTNPAPANITGLVATGRMAGVEFEWGANTEPDFRQYAFRLRVEADSWSNWFWTSSVRAQRFLTDTEKNDHGSEANIQIEVIAFDAFLSESSVPATANSDCLGLSIDATDIDDMSVLSNEFVDIPIIQGLTFTNNDPSPGYVSWTACTIHYNGETYDIGAHAAGTTAKYIYWKDLTSGFSGSNDHPSTLGDWTPQEDFIIATNTSGAHEKAWSAMANSIISSAWIQDLAVTNAKISNLDAAKITTGFLDAARIQATSIVVGKLASSATNLMFSSSTRDFADLAGSTKPANNAQVNTIDAGDGLDALDSTANTKLGTIATNADVTSANVAASITGQGALAVADDLDDVPDGDTYGRVNLTAISGGKIVLTGNGVTGTLSVTYTDAQVNTINSGDGLSALDTSQNTKLNGIATGAQVNTINSGDGLNALDSTANTKLAGIDEGADVTSAHTAAGVAGQGALATKDSVNLNSGEVTSKSLANLDSTANTKLGTIATNADVTSANVAASVTGQGALATKSSVNLNSGEVTSKSLANLDSTASSKLGGIDEGADVTSANVAASVTGQGALATKSSVNLNSSEVTSKSLANLDSTASSKLGGIDEGATVGATWGSNIGSQPTNLAGINSSEGSKLTGIDAGAEVNTINSGDGLAALDSGQDTKLDGIDAGADVTSANVAASITGQGALATKSSVNLNSAEVTSKSLANLDSTANTKLSGIDTGADVTSAEPQDLDWLDGSAGTLTISSTGNLSITAAGGLLISAALGVKIQSEGSLEVESGGGILVKSGGGITLEGGGDFRLEDGGDLILEPHDSNPAIIRFEDTGGSDHFEIFRTITDDILYIRPVNDGTGDLRIGYLDPSGTDYLWDWITLEAIDRIAIKVRDAPYVGGLTIDSDADEVEVLLSSTGSAGTAALHLHGNLAAVEIQGDFIPNTDGTLNLGKSGSQWKSLGLKPLSSEPSSPYDGMMAMCDGSGWQISSTRKILAMWIDGSWRQIVVGPA